MSEPVNFDSPSVRARVETLRRQEAEAGVSAAEFDAAIDRANQVDGNTDLFTDIDLSRLEQAVANMRTRQAGLATPGQTGISLRGPKSIAEQIDSDGEDDSRSAAQAKAAGSTVTTDIARDAVPAQAVAGTPPAGTELRNLADVGVTNTSYWGRVSPDGAIFAIGSNRGVLAVDLRDGHNNAVAFHQGSYDPTFTRDALIFQGGGTWRAPLDWLKNNPPSDVNGEVPGFVTRIGSLNLYQDAGTAGADRHIVIDGYQWSGDSGPSTRDPRVQGSANSTLRIQDVSSLRGGTASVQSVLAPFHSGFQLSLDGEHVTSIITDPANPSQQVGYAVYKINRNTDSGQVTLEPLRVASGLRGGKPKMGGDYVGFHHAVTAADFAAYGFASADDPAFQELLRKGTADIFLYNFRDNTVRRATNAGPGNLAWYPSFYEDANGRLMVAYLQQNANGRRSVMTVPAAQ